MVLHTENASWTLAKCRCNRGRAIVFEHTAKQLLSCDWLGKSKKRVRAEELDKDTACKRPAVPAALHRFSGPERGVLQTRLQPLDVVRTQFQRFPYLTYLIDVRLGINMSNQAGLKPVELVFTVVIYGKRVVTLHGL